ncbi:relaxase domain-containing protein [Streptomyces sp. KLMMK]|uniref:relaxase domain-containing protein n=1 Tax=Streptomyces sp. KLMMK TaxID=3109353 RepID=UPI003FA78753
MQATLAEQNIPSEGLQNLSAGSMLEHIVAAGTLCTVHFMEEVSARLGWAWEPREVTPGRRPVKEVAGIDQRLIGWQSTHRRQIPDAKSLLVADCEERQGHPPGERAADYALDAQAADRTRRPKPTAAGSLTELRDGWRASAVRAFGVDVISRARSAGAGGGHGGVGPGAAGGRRRPGGRGHGGRPWCT